MAKAKTATPKKSKKSTTTLQTATPVRRSPRLTKAPKDEPAITKDKIENKVVKRTGAKKTATTSKPSAKATGKKAPTKTKSSKFPSLKKTGAPAVDPEPLPFPKRGRPKKDTKTTSTGKSRAPSQPRASSRAKSQTPEDETYAPSPDADADADGQWTDSPKKRRAPDAMSKASCTATASKKKSAGAGSVRKSIELPEINMRRRSSSPSRKTSTSPVRRRNNTSTGQKPRGSSIGSRTSTAKRQSKSPARKPSAESKVSVNFGVDDAPAVSPKRGRSTSPRKRTASRSRSLAKSQGGNDVAGKAASPVKKDRSRSKSPAKSTGRKASKVSSEVSVLSTVEGSQGPRGRLRASSSGKELDSTPKNETRGSRGSAKASPSKGRTSRSASPKKSERTATTSRRLSDPSPPPRTARSASPAKRRPKDEHEFAERMAQQDEYGGFLKEIERCAYRAYKNGADLPDKSYPSISKEDKKRAISEGRERARLQLTLNTKGAVLKAPSQPRKGSSTSRIQEIGSDDENMLDELSYKPGESNDQARRSPQRCRSSGTSQASRKRSASRSRSPSKSPSKKSDDAAELLAHGQSSGDGRGAIQSVTNQQIIPDSNRKNPFFETMPAPEVWHRRMPPFLPFGETPFMEREMSRRISEDLARGEEKTQGGWLSNILPSMPWKSSIPEQRPYVSPWTLPEPTDAQRKAVAKDVSRFMDSQSNIGGTKRKASEQAPRSSVKRVRRRSRGEDAMMSGAL